MNIQILRLIAPLAVSALSMNVALATNSSETANSKIIDECKNDADCMVIPASCNMTIPPENQAEKKWVVEGDVKCPMGALEKGSETDEYGRAYLKSAAVNIVGEGLTVTFTGNILCNGVLDDVNGKSNTSKDATEELNTVGIWVSTDNNTIKGGSSANDISTHIYNCNVSIEVSELAMRYQSDSMNDSSFPPQPVKKVNNVIEYFKLYNCNSGVRVLTNGNIVRGVNAKCGAQQPASKSYSFDGFVLNAKALDPADNTYCTGNEEIFPAISHNVFEYNVAEFNYNGFLGGNELPIRNRYQPLTNHIRHNKASQNLNVGILLVGTGHQVTKNQSSTNGNAYLLADSIGSGIVVSLNNPNCNSNSQREKSYTLNRVSENTVEHNSAHGLAAIYHPDNGKSPYDSDGSDNQDWERKYANAGTEFKKNVAFNNASSSSGSTPYYDLYDNNGDCSNGRSEQYKLNEWSFNNGWSVPTNAEVPPFGSCVGDWLKAQ